MYSILIEAGVAPLWDGCISDPDPALLCQDLRMCTGKVLIFSPALYPCVLSWGAYG